MKAKTGFKYAGWGVLGVAGMILFTFVVMWLWNWLVPELFNGPVLNYWQTLGLFILSKILFSGVGGGSGSKSSHKHKHDCGDGDYHGMPKSRWRQKYEAKMNGKVEKEKDDEGEVIIPETE
ncbi:MAG: hypothetical protein E4H10_10595 [Bacteroidia bacterium]|jgi:hypothetical protein|nr:MAG: hypothetical protein E4H10_10595 [Bacteroidia bacterium]